MSETSYENYVSDWTTSLEALKRLDNVWIGPDIALVEPCVVAPGALVQVRVLVSKEHLPNIPVNRGALKNLEWSTRSFYAQTGIDIRFERHAVTDEMIEALKSGAQVSIPMAISNHGQRAVEISGNIMRFFWTNFSSRLKGKELYDAVASGAFGVEGVEGEDYFFADIDGNQVRSDDANGTDGVSVAIRLKQERHYIPNEAEPVKKNDALSTRQDLAQLLKPIPPDMPLSFEIGETPRIQLDERTTAVIHLNSYDDGEMGVAKRGHQHINSPLIDPKFAGPIRTETLHGMTHVEFFIFQTKKPE